MNYRLENMDHFGMREIEMAADLMKAYANGGAPDSFYDDGVTVEFNPQSGKVFLVNSDFQVLTIDGNGRLYEMYSRGYAGKEGDAETLYFDFKNGNVDENDYEQLECILESEGMEEEAEEVRKAIEFAENAECESA